MSNLELVIFTNEKYFDILYVTLPRIINFIGIFDIGINVVTNRMPSGYEGCDGANFIDCDIDFQSDGSHFASCMNKALSMIRSKYILFFCDDYMVNSNVKINNLNSILQIINQYNSDFFSFASLNYCDGIISKWNILQNGLNDFNLGSGGTLYGISENYRHLYSVQPCIWKKESFLELIKFNSDLSIKSLDLTDIRNKKGFFRHFNHNTNLFESEPNTALDYEFKNLIINYPPLTYNIDDRPIGSDYLVFDYGEILRCGKVIERNTNSKKILMEFIESNVDIKNKIRKFL